MRTVVAVLAVALLGLAGCSSKSTPDNYTCLHTGKVIDLSKVAGSSAKGFDPESACPPPTPPSVAFVNPPSSMTAFFPVLFAWSVWPGNYTSGPSMLTQVMWSHHAVDPAGLKDPTTFTTNAPLVMYAHQEVPAKFDGKVKFTTPGTYYLRVYAQVRGDGLPDTDYWSPELKMVVGEVNATGKVQDFTHDVGASVAGQTGKFTPTAAPLVLGDGIVLVNKDVVDHTFTFDANCKSTPAVTVKAAAPGGAAVKSDPIIMKVPGSCTVVSDDQGGKQTVTANVAEPV